jgi:predicted acyltransferase
MGPSFVAAPASPATRLVSLDVFRGLTMAAMVIVNNPGDWGNVYAPLLHAPWHGWTPTDLIFPFFLFIVGVSITLSAKSTGTASILRRGALIFGLGLFLAGYPRFDWTSWRIPGVLQRIALCYVAAAFCYRGVQGSFRRRATVLGGIGLGLCILYYALMMFVPVPGGDGLASPERASAKAGDLSADGNLAAYVDRALMGGHLWRPTWDPEGLLSTVPAIATTLFGVVAGLWLKSANAESRKVRWLVLAGIAGIAAGYAWHPFFPINKNIWTSSYVLFTAGAASLLLALCYWAIDLKGWRGWTKPFVILGVNAITLFVGSALLVKTMNWIRVDGPEGSPIALSRWIYASWFVPLASPKDASLLYAIANLVLLFAVLAWMYRRRIFLRV